MYMVGYEQNQLTLDRVSSQIRDETKASVPGTKMQWAAVKKLPRTRFPEFEY